MRGSRKNTPRPGARRRLRRRTCAAAVATLAVSLAACHTPPRVYTPACPAYTGDRIVLEDSRFTWHRYTDVIELGPDGEPADPYPDFPKSGEVRRANGELTFMRDGAEIAAFSLVEAAGEQYLLTTAEASAVRAGGGIPPCALRLSESGD